ncbi:hypothetical protein Q4I30_007198 [Leishmania utingensis]|uniref:Uncharacterized protein n=1 Tax=Leishmania utingensis TaxID=653362 RepID=A0AAW2ZYP9_9TRYP
MSVLVLVVHTLAIIVVLEPRLALFRLQVRALVALFVSSHVQAIVVSSGRLHNAGSSRPSCLWLRSTYMGHRSDITVVTRIVSHLSCITTFPPMHPLASSLQDSCSSMTSDFSRNSRFIGSAYGSSGDVYAPSLPRDAVNVDGSLNPCVFGNLSRVHSTGSLRMPSYRSDSFLMNTHAALVNHGSFGADQMSSYDSIRFNGFGGMLRYGDANVLYANDTRDARPCQVTIRRQNSLRQLWAHAWHAAHGDDVLHVQQ